MIQNLIVYRLEPGDGGRVDTFTNRNSHYPHIVPTAMVRISFRDATEHPGNEPSIFPQVDLEMTVDQARNLMTALEGILK